MNEQTPQVNKEALKHNFLKTLEGELKGFDYEVVVENGVAMVIAWYGLIQMNKGGAETIVSKMMSTAKKEDVDFDIFIAGETAFPTRRRLAAPGGKIVGIFFIHDDDKVPEKSKNWYVRSSEDQSVTSIGFNVTTNLLSPEKFLTEHIKMVSYGKSIMGKDTEVRLGNGLFGKAVQFRIELRKKK